MLSGTTQLGGDKSISHRVLMFAAMSKGKCYIKNLSKCTDVQRTITILKNCGISITNYQNEITILGSHSMHSTKKRFYCGNSGTTARFMLGFLPAHGITGTLYGDKSLSARPMKRIIEPLKKMNIKLLTKTDTLPIKFNASNTQNINHTLVVPSAQVKSSLIFAALSCSAHTVIEDKFNTRDHTERLIKYLGYKKEYYTKFTINAFNYTVPGDISSASYLIAATLLIPNSNVTIKNILFNKTRTGYIRTLQKMGGKISIMNKRSLQNEPVCDLNIKYTKKLNAVTITSDQITSMIDEIPIFALICAHSHGISKIKGATELRYKESDRIKSIVHNFNNLNINIQEHQDGFTIQGPNILYNTSINSFNDHRIALLGEIIKIINNRSLSDNFETKSLIETSFPEFYKIMGDLHE